MDTAYQQNYTSLDLKSPIWDQVFTVAPLVVIGTKEGEGYDLAPKHMITPLGFGNYFGFVCTPRHSTYHNIKASGEFAVSFPVYDQLVATSLSASSRSADISKFHSVISALNTIAARTVDAPLLEGAYLYLECKLYRVIDGFDDYSLITGKVKAAYGHKDYLKVSERDEQDQLTTHPLLAYVAPGRFAKISQTHGFPFPKNFKR